jgi:hypothetical protein
MTIQAEQDRRTARCDCCRLVTPAMRVADDQAAVEIIRAAGWRLVDTLTYCPRCDGIARTSVATRAAQLRNLSSSR